MIEYCGYYGIYNNVKPKSTLGEYMVDEAYQRILDKHEAELVRRQNKIIMDLKKSFSDNTKSLLKRFILIENRIKELEINFKKDKDDAPSKRKKGKNS